uniref:Uncharacterized protein n=1 Tax=Timema shepardi TaxID=629360 RepID=A0A7R9B8K9_TIMSH|nr:unnamed protein product [Timema shepardi]
MVAVKPRTLHVKENRVYPGLHVSADGKRRNSLMASLVLTDSSQLTADGFEKLSDQIMYPHAEPNDLQKHLFSSDVGPTSVATGARKLNLLWFGLQVTNSSGFESRTGLPREVFLKSSFLPSIAFSADTYQWIIKYVFFPPSGDVACRPNLHQAGTSIRLNTDYSALTNTSLDRKLLFY